jgi:chromosome partitioning protein
MNTIKLVRSSFNPHLKLEGILLTMYDSRTNLSAQVVEEVSNYFKDKVFRTIIPRNVKLSEAPSFGMPIQFYDPLSLGSKSYIEFTKELLNHEEKRT